MFLFSLRRKLHGFHAAIEEEEENEEGSEIAVIREKFAFLK